MLIKLRCKYCFAKVSADDEYIGKDVSCPACNAPFKLPEPQFGFGKSLGGYEIEQWLGAGAMGEVYLARQVSMNRLVALKVMRRDVSEDREVVDRFVLEAQTLATLNHPNIVPAFDADHTDECYYMAMGYIDGETLEDKLKRTGPFQEIEVLQISQKVADALRYAWEEHKLLHRDIKPANIMLDKLGEVRIMDMGIAKDTTEDGGLTAAGLVVGTPFYMSPEQAQSSEDIDYRSDVYALGASMYHLLTGTLPFQGVNVMAILAKKVNHPAVAACELNSQVTKQTSKLIQSLLEYKPDERFGDFDDLEKKLASALVAAKKEVKKRTKMNISFSGPIETNGSGVKTATLPKDTPRNGSSSAKSFGNKRQKILIGALCIMIVLLFGVLFFGEDKPRTVLPKQVENKALSMKDVLLQHQLFSWSADVKNDRKKLKSYADAKYADSGIMSLRGGSFSIGQTKNLMEKLRKADQFSIQLQFSGLPRQFAATVFASANDAANVNFSLQQNKDRFYLNLSSVLSGKVIEKEKLLFTQERKFLRKHNLFISYKSGSLIVMYNGKVKTFSDVHGSIKQWKDYKISFGDIAPGKYQYWRGSVQSAAIYDVWLDEPSILKLQKHLESTK